MKKTVKFICVLLCIALCVSFCACSGDNSSAIIYYCVTEQPKTVDPQRASSSAELMVVRNIFEGLLRENSNGEIVNGVISGYEKNGLTYTFNIRENAAWQDGTKLTANDFVFAFKRALSPEIAAPYAKSLYCIKNAKAINEGKLAPDNLGVYAESDSKLIIELEYEDSAFTSTLTTAICMPCNEQFFGKSVGKYGMSYETVLSNGSYKMRKWDTADFAMRITKNAEYTGDFTPKNAAVYFSKSKEYSNLKCLDKNYCDIAALDIEEASAAKNNGYNTLDTDNSVIVLSIGDGIDKDMRKALYSCAADKSDFEGDTPRIAETVYPEMLNIGADKINLYDPQTAVKLFYERYKALKLTEFPQKTIIYYGNSDVYETAKCIASHWQQILGIYINISKAETKEKLNYTRRNDANAIAVYSVTVNESNADSYLLELGAEKSGSFNETQQKIIAEYSSIPLTFGKSFYAYDKVLQNVYLFPTNGIFDFSYIIKKD